MYLFTRRATLSGSERNSMAWAVEMSAYVDSHSSHDVSVWRADFGYPVGTVVWSAWAESQNALNEGFASLADDDGYHSLAEKGAEFFSVAEDELREAIHGAPGDDAAALGSVTTVTTAVMAGGQYSEGGAWSVGMAQLIEEISGLPAMFLLDSYGTFGQVTWLSGAPDLATADAANAKVNADAEYLKRLEAVGDLFVPGSGHRSLFTRIG